MTLPAPWLERALAFDTETTGTDVFTDRIVTACALEVGSRGLVSRGTWLVYPVVPIPAAATAIHGVTDEMARKGQTPLEALPEIRRALTEAWADGLPVIACNAPFDLTLLQAELVRHGRPLLEVGPVVDPLVLDRTGDPYRKGKRTLAALAQVYKVKQDEAHSSHGDALTAARVVWALVKRYPEVAAMDLESLQDFQRDAHRAWATNFEAFLSSQGRPQHINPEWPVQTARVEERAA